MNHKTTCQQAAEQQCALYMQMAPPACRVRWTSAAISSCTSYGTHLLQIPWSTIFGDGIGQSALSQSLEGSGFALDPFAIQCKLRSAYKASFDSNNGSAKAQASNQDTSCASALLAILIATAFFLEQAVHLLLTCKAFRPQGVVFKLLGMCIFVV